MSLRDVLADLRIRVRGGEQLRAANRSVGTFVAGVRTALPQLGAFATAMASALAVREVAQFTTELIDLGDELGKTSQQLGLSTDQLQAWRFAADRAGVDGRAMSQSFMRLQRAAFEASRGSAQYVEAFRALGVTVDDGNGNLLEADQLMTQMARGMGALDDETRKVALAQTLMGRSGARLLPLLNGGEEGVADLLQRFRELGGGLSADFVVNAEAAQDALTDWNTATLSFKSQLGAALLPTLTRVLNVVTEWSVSIGAALRRSNALEVGLWALVAVLGALAIAFAVAFLPLTLGLLGFGLLVLLIDDLIVAFQGGESALGALIDGIFGVGATQTIVEALTSAWEGFVDVLREAGQLLGLVEDPGNLSPEARQRREFRSAFMAAQGKNETTPDGAEARGGGRVPRPRLALNAEALRGLIGQGPVIPVGQVAQGAPSRTDVRVDSRPSITINGGGDPERTRRLVERALSDHERRLVNQAVAELPQGAT